jgi:hypothetical protein
MEEFLPILIGIIWLVYTFYTKGKKKPASKRPASEPRKTSQVESIITELFGDKIETYDEEQSFESFDPMELEVEEQEEYVSKQTASPFLQHEINEFVEEGEHVFENNLENDPELESVNIDYKDEIQEFNLRKAVIYSEILNAPYL